MIARRILLRHVRSFIFILPTLSAIILLPPALSSASPIERGKEIFAAKCTPCHTIGGGRKVGPDLRGVTSIRPKSWLSSFISDPGKMFNTNDPTAIGLLKEYQMKMPNLGLSAEDVNAVISYLGAPTGAAPESKTVAPSQAEAKEPSPAADVERGKKYFSGQLAFKNNGPACMACHSAAGIKFWGGGTLGPDLTGVYAQMGEGIVSLLVNVPFPTMKPIFDSHPLSEDEARDLAAFLKATASRQPENNSTKIITSSFFAFVVLMAIILVIWRNRLTSVRKAMVDRAKQEGDQR